MILRHLSESPHSRLLTFAARQGRGQTCTYLFLDTCTAIYLFPLSSCITPGLETWERNGTEKERWAWTCFSHTHINIPSLDFFDWLGPALNVSHLMYEAIFFYFFHNLYLDAQ